MVQLLEQTGLVSLWPYNPEGHLQNITGKNNASLHSFATAFYLPGMMPVPWTYCLVTVFVSFVSVLSATIDLWKAEKSTGYSRLGELSTKPKPKPPRNHHRKRTASLVYALVRTLGIFIAFVVSSPTKTSRVTVTTVSIIISLVANVWPWDGKVDFLSCAATLGATILTILSIWQTAVILATQRADYNSNGLAAGHAYGAIGLAGGICPRALLPSEKCSALQLLGCSPEPVSRLASYGVMVLPAQFALGFGAFVSLCYLSMIWHIHLKTFFHPSTYSHHLCSLDYSNQRRQQQHPRTI